MPKRKLNVVKRKAEKKRGAIPFLRLERRPDNDDDWVVFEFDGPPDPAVAPLKP